MKRPALLVVMICALIIMSGVAQSQNAPLLKVGHVGHDHHLALYVAALNGETFKQDYGLYLKEIRPKELYELYDGEKLITEVELVKAGGGAQMPTAMDQGAFDVGFGGIAAVAFHVDKERPMKVIAPLHSKGDMLMVDTDVPAKDWTSFVQYAKTRKEQLKIGYKAPKAVALLILQTALDAEGISYTHDASVQDAKVLLINMKGEEFLNSGLQNDIIDAYVSNNPHCAVGEEKGIGCAIANLDDLPPGIWKEHPCCIIAAMDDVIKSKHESIVKFLELMIIATRYINQDQKMAVASASKWIGTSEKAEKISIPTSAYLTDPTPEWVKGIHTWAKEMKKSGDIKGKLAMAKEEEFDGILLDLSLLKEAQQNFKQRQINK